MQNPSLSSDTLIPRIACHLKELAVTLSDVENALGDILPVEIAPQTLLRLQTLDHIRQSVEDLSLLMTLIGQETQTQNTCFQRLSQKNDQLSLESTKRLLKPQTSHSNSGNSGTIDLF
jgi:hypothetical protein